MSKPSIPKGTRDFLPVEMERRNYIFDTIREAFRKFGFLQIETPAMENISTLLGKYGDEGDKLLFRILNSGNFLDGVSTAEQDVSNVRELTLKIAEKGLRYDLTVPFARFVVQHRDAITFPFRRYQIQPVWRADRPQRGRYREFYQCDADIVGSDSLLNEVELIELIDDVFGRLGINVSIKINNRKILAGIAELIGEADKITDITVAIDKLDKIGLDNVNKELEDKGISLESIELLQPILMLGGDNGEKLDKLRHILTASTMGQKGIEETETILSYLADCRLAASLELDLTLARGLNYYTGAIIEVKARRQYGKYLWRRQIRQPHRSIRIAGYFGCRCFVRGRPYIRRARYTWTVPNTFGSRYTDTFRCVRRRGTQIFTANSPQYTPKRYCRRTLPRQCQDKETDAVC